MTFETEDEVKNALGIETWRNLPKENVVKLAAMRPDIDAELAKTIVAQLPVSTRLGVDVLTAMRKAHDSTLGANRHSQDRVHEAFAEVRKMAREELEKQDLSVDDRRYYHQVAMDTARKEFEKDSENKRLLDGWLGKAVTVVGVVVVAAGAAIVGGRAVLQRGDEGASSDGG